MTNKPILSIVIPTFNEEMFLPKLLKSIKNQTFEDYEIIIADNNSKDNTTKIAREYKCRLVKGGLPSTGRNNGANVAKGDYILFLDADVILPMDFLEKSLKEFEYRYLEAATCEFIPLSDKKIDKVLHDVSIKFLKTMQYFKPFGPGFCLLVTKRIHKRVNGFDENLSFCEDHDYVYRISRLAKFRLLKNTRIFVSIRRLDKEGRKKLALKYAKAVLYQLADNKESMKKIEYKFGHS